jgi:GntR family transcriptional regulator
VAHSFRARIGHGDWPAGTKLPTFNELATEYGVAVVTIHQAVALLAADGLLSSGRGRGTFVGETVQPVRENTNLRIAINDHLDLPSNTSIRILRRDVSATLPSCFGKVEEPRYLEYVTVRKLHLIDNEPFALLKVSVASSVLRHSWAHSGQM